jgi:hypothetical protein
LSYRGAKLTGFKHHKKNHSILQNFTNSGRQQSLPTAFIITIGRTETVFNCLWAICVFFSGILGHFDQLPLKKGQKSPKEKILLLRIYLL